MKKEITAIKNFVTKHKRMPSYQEIARLYGYASKNSAYQLIEKFISQKKIIKDDKGFLSLVDDNHGLPILGSVQAGFPSLGEEVFHQSISLDEWVVRDQDATYILEVEGDSMIEAGIHKGDYVVVERTHQFKPGNIVIAEVDGDWTMKYFAKKDGKEYLQAANPDFTDIYPKEYMTVHAKVVGVVRRYE